MKRRIAARLAWMDGQRTRPARLAFLVHSVSPYRLPIIEELNKQFDLRVIVSGAESNRRWEQLHIPGVATRRAWGVMLRTSVKRPAGGVLEERHLHMNPGYFWELVRFRPDVIISTEMGFRSVLAVLYGKLFRKPVVVWWEGGRHSSRLYGNSPLKRLLRHRFFVPQVKHWLSFGDVSTEYLESVGVVKRRIQQVQNAVDDRAFSVDAEPYPLTVPAPRILFVGRLIENKGIYPLLTALASAQARGYECSLVVVGEGPEAARFESQRRQLGITRYQRIDWIEPDEMPSIYKACDFMVFPTFDDVWGLVVNEAILAGVPVISSPFAGCAAELLPPTNIFNPHDPIEFESIVLNALRGEIAPADRTRIQPMREVADLIAQTAREALSSTQEAKDDRDWKWLRRPARRRPTGFIS